MDAIDAIFPFRVADQPREDRLGRGQPALGAPDPRVLWPAGRALGSSCSVGESGGVVMSFGRVLGSSLTTLLRLCKCVKVSLAAKATSGASSGQGGSSSPLLLAETHFGPSFEIHGWTQPICGIDFGLFLLAIRLKTRALATRFPNSLHQTQNIALAHQN